MSKNRVTISISGDVQERLEKVGSLYGLKLSNMLERSARFYLEEIEDMEIALHRTKHEKEEMTLEEVKKELELEG
ncbi:hypothetical protein ACFL4T_08170 [candidate division KSB1 bacterium]